MKTPRHVLNLLQFSYYCKNILSEDYELGLDIFPDPRTDLEPTRKYPSWNRTINLQVSFGF